MPPLVVFVNVVSLCALAHWVDIAPPMYPVARTPYECLQGAKVSIVHIAQISRAEKTTEKTILCTVNSLKYYRRL